MDRNRFSKNPLPKKHELPTETMFFYDDLRMFETV
jgi:hypothetical protein